MNLEEYFEKLHRLALEQKRIQEQKLDSKYKKPTDTDEDTSL
jgi:hypothetical protein